MGVAVITDIHADPPALEATPATVHDARALAREVEEAGLPSEFAQEPVLAA